MQIQTEPNASMTATPVANKGVGMSLETLLLSQEMFKSRVTQVITSVLLLVLLGIQIYLFVGINQVLQMALAAV